ncbi:hypothetical protein [Actinomyces ruminis]|nr:hypothetical protein [Actinomyces ruminis]
MSTDDDAPPSQPMPGSRSPRRNQTRRADILRGLRAGGLLAAAIAGIWAGWQARRNPGVLGPHSSSLDPLSLSFILLLVAATVWAFYACIVEPADSPRPRRTLLLAAMLVLVPTTIAVVLIGRYWWQRSQAIGLPYPVLSQLAVASAGIGATVTASLLLHLERGSLTPSKQPLLRHLRPTRTTTAVAVLTITVATTALALPANTFQPQSTQVTATEAEPIPETLGNQGIWWHTFDHNDSDSLKGVVAGATGPIVITEHGAQGLDPHTGETTWSYTRPAEIQPFEGGKCRASDTVAGCSVGLSPDRTHLVLGYGTGGEATLLVVLDTTTGAVAFEHMHAIDDVDRTWRSWGTHIQVTDHVLAAGEEVLSLTDGSLVASLPEVDIAACDNDSMCYSYGGDEPSYQSEWVFSSFFQGGHSTLILGAYCPHTDPLTSSAVWCDVTLAPDNDLTAVTTVGGILPEFDSGPVVVDGWTVRYDDPEATYQDVGERPKDFIDTHPVDAVSLDALSGAGDAAPVPLGDLIYPEQVRASRTLKVLGISPTVVIFDPITGQVNDLQKLTEQRSGLGYLDDLKIRQPLEYGNVEARLEYIREHGLEESPEELGYKDWKDLEARNHDYSAIQQLNYEDITDPADIAAADGTLAYYHDGYLVPAPGVITLVHDRAVVDDNDGTSNHQTVVVGLG